jgi:DNA-binding GntR family transcriptional regulator
MPPSFAELEPLSLKDRVVSALKDAFFSGSLKPGDPIVERDVARQMRVGTPVVREALISLQGQGFVRRIANTGTYVSEFEKDEVRQLYSLRIELEVLAFRWARQRVTEADLNELADLLASVVRAGEAGDRRRFLECDYEFHRHCWKLSGNTYLYETLDRLMAPLFAFVVLASDVPMTASMGKEHYELLRALRELQEPEFSSVVRRTISGFAVRWVTAIAPGDEAGL